MIRLLIADFMRVKKNKLFWILCGAMALVALMLVVNAISSKDTQIDNPMCFSVIPVEIAAAIFISIFFGTEYSDGTMRNKLIVGHDRRKIYLSNWITALLCAFVLFVCYQLPIAIFGYSLVALPTAEAIQTVAVGVVTLFAFSSLFTMVSMIYSNKAGATVVNLVLAFVLLFAAMILCTYLAQPEFFTSHNMAGEMEYVRNPNYVSGILRTLLQTITDVLPSGQAFQFMTGVSSPLWVLPLYSSGVCAACTAAGAAVFFKKDMK